MPQFVGRKINIVLSDGTAILGILKNVRGHEFEMENMARRRQRYPLADIIEIYIDSVA